MPSKSYFGRDAPAPDALHFDFDIVGYGPEGRSVETIQEQPVVGVELQHGWLLGSDRGEWGGALVYKTDQAENLLLEDNIEDIYKFSSGYIVTAGLSHLGLSGGSIYLIEGDEPNFKSEVLFSLPAAPESSWLLSPSELLVNVEGEMSYLLRDDGTLTKVKCESDSQ